MKKSKVEYAKIPLTRPASLNLKMTIEEKSEVTKFCKENNLVLSAFVRTVLVNAMKQYKD